MPAAGGTPPAALEADILFPMPSPRRASSGSSHAAAERVVANGREVAVSNPGKVLFPEAGHTKLDLVRYYLAVADGALGNILHIEGNFSNEHSTRVTGGWRDDPRESPGGGMTGAGLHVLDAFVNLGGPIAKVDARVFSQKPPPDPRDAAAAMMQFESGATGLLRLAGCAGPGRGR